MIKILTFQKFLIPRTILGFCLSVCERGNSTNKSVIPSTSSYAKAGHSPSICSNPFGGLLNRPFSCSAHKIWCVIHRSNCANRTYGQPHRLGYCASSTPHPDFPRMNPTHTPSPHFVVFALVRETRFPKPTILFQFYGLVGRMKIESGWNSNFFSVYSNFYRYFALTKRYGILSSKKSGVA
ncbi:hypothetical protein AVEN_187838-1 [Araneus ventricosus]|uniref:Secreted protein n=1 Tax=Araneus ventricosus TaxID=182803 RepID=A0A4Y2CTT3_ARAVE|nr:hypothetical protein AVEN_187838-1 [Araneus ventricosus]